MLRPTTQEMDLSSLARWSPMQPQVNIKIKHTDCNVIYLTVFFFINNEFIYCVVFSLLFVN